MYAIIETGGKQYRIQVGDVVQIEKKEGDIGSTLTFTEILFLNKKKEESEILIGKPYINHASVQGEIVGQGRGTKILIVKMKRRKQYRRTQGHRQNYTQVLITSIRSSLEESLDLSPEEKTLRLARFQSHLKPKGQAHTAPLLGSRKKRRANELKKATQTSQVIHEQ